MSAPTRASAAQGASAAARTRTSAPQARPRAIHGAIDQVLRSPGRALDGALRLSLERGLGPVDAAAAVRPAAPAALPVIRADDPLEREADRVADRFVAQMIDAQRLPPQLSRGPLRGTRAPAGPTVSPFTSPFRADFGRVRIHTGPAASAAARALSAQAFALGDDVVFGEGAFAPGRPDGLRLLAHELAHVAQRAAGLILRKGDADAPLASPAAQEIGDKDDDAEAAALQRPEIAPVAGAQATALPAPVASAPVPGAAAGGASRAPVRDAKLPSAPGTEAAAAANEAPPAKAAGDLPTSDLGLIDEELAEHERWGAAAQKVGAASSEQRAGFIADQAGEGSAKAFKEGAYQGAKTAIEMKIAEKVIAKAAVAVATRMGAQAARFTPLPGVGAVIGGVMAGIELAKRDWGATGKAIAAFGKGADVYETLANSIEAISNVLEVATQVANVVAGILGAITIIMWAVTVATAGIASPLAATLTTVSLAIGGATLALDAINALVLKELITMFRALHAFASEADPRDVVAQGAAIEGAAGAASGFVGGLVGAKVAEKGMHYGGKKIAPKLPGHPNPPAAGGEGPSVKGEPAPKDAAGATPPANEAAAAPSAEPAAKPAASEPAVAKAASPEAASPDAASVKPAAPIEVEAVPEPAKAAVPETAEHVTAKAPDTAETVTPTAAEPAATEVAAPEAAAPAETAVPEAAPKAKKAAAKKAAAKKPTAKKPVLAQATVEPVVSEPGAATGETAAAAPAPKKAAAKKTSAKKPAAKKGAGKKPPAEGSGAGGNDPRDVADFEARQAAFEAGAAMERGEGRFRKEGPPLEPPTQVLEQLAADTPEARQMRLEYSSAQGNMAHAKLRENVRTRSQTAADGVKRSAHFGEASQRLVPEVGFRKKQVISVDVNPGGQPGKAKTADLAIAKQPIEPARWGELKGQSGRAAFDGALDLKMGGASYPGREDFRRQSGGLKVEDLPPYTKGLKSPAGPGTPETSFAAPAAPEPTIASTPKTPAGVEAATPTAPTDGPAIKGADVPPAPVVPEPALAGTPPPSAIESAAPPEPLQGGGGKDGGAGGDVGNAGDGGGGDEPLLPGLTDAEVDTAFDSATSGPLVKMAAKNATFRTSAKDGSYWGKDELGMQVHKWGVESAGVNGHPASAGPRPGKGVEVRLHSADPRQPADSHSGKDWTANVVQGDPAAVASGKKGKGGGKSPAERWRMLPDGTWFDRESAVTPEGKPVDVKDFRRQGEDRKGTWESKSRSAKGKPLPADEGTKAGLDKWDSDMNDSHMPLFPERPTGAGPTGGTPGPKSSGGAAAPAPAAAAPQAAEAVIPEGPAPKDSTPLAPKRTAQAGEAGQVAGDAPVVAEQAPAVAATPQPAAPAAPEAQAAPAAEHVEASAAPVNDAAPVAARATATTASSAPATAAPAPAPAAPTPKPASTATTTGPAADESSTKPTSAPAAAPTTDTPLPPAPAPVAQQAAEPPLGAGVATDAPVVERVNPAYQAPPGTPDDLVSLRNQIIDTLQARAVAEEHAHAMGGQVKHHEANEEPVAKMKDGTEEALTATDAHKKAVAHRDEANERKKAADEKTHSTIDDYTTRAGRLASLTLPMKGLSRFTGLAHSLPDDPGVVARFKNGVLKVNHDSTNFLDQLAQMDATMAAQKGEQAQREQATAADGATLKQTDEKAAKSNQDLTDAKQSTEDFEQKNKERKEDAQAQQKDAQQTAGTLGAQAASKEARAVSLAAAMQFWARGHAKARADAIEATKRKLQAQGYRVTEVREK